MTQTYTYHEIFDAMRKVVPASVQIYLVGGAVRDILQNKKIKDFDFVAEGLVRPIGKKLARELNGKYYVMDDERNIVRVILNHDSNDCYCIDIAQFTGPNLNEDLLSRDFTINAIAIDFMQKNIVVDPLMGATDLQKKRLRMCSIDSLEKDPLRAMRAIRMALEYSLTMDAELIAAIKGVVPLFPSCSMERYRDEFFKILALEKTSSAIQLLEKFGFLSFMFQTNLDDEIQPLLSFSRSIDHLLNILTKTFNEEESSNLFSGLTVLKIGKFREQLKEFFDDSISMIHDHRSLLLFTLIASSYHIDSHEKRADVIKKRAKTIILSADEIKYSSSVYAAWQQLKSDELDQELSDTQLYRYYRKFASYGIDGLFLYLADSFCSNNSQTDINHWTKILERCVKYLDAWFNRFYEIVKPEKLISGNQLSEVLNIPSGPKIGMIKEAITEAQIEKKISTYEEAIVFAKKILLEPNE